MRMIRNNFQSKFFGQSKFHAIQLLIPKIEKIELIAQKNLKKLKFQNLLHLNLECMESQLFWPRKFPNSSVSVAASSIFS